MKSQKIDTKIFYELRDYIRLILDITSGGACWIYRYSFSGLVVMI